MYEYETCFSLLKYFYLECDLKKKIINLSHSIDGAVNSYEEYLCKKCTGQVLVYLSILG